MKLLILGATGFIGKNLTLFFSRQKGFEVTAARFTRDPLGIEGISEIDCDLRDPKSYGALDLGAFDAAIHCAATTSGAKDIVNSPWLHVTDNAVMNSYLFRAAAEQKLPHLIFLSCTVMYPSSTEPVKESGFNGDILDRYYGVGWTKVYSENMCRFFAGKSQTKFTVLRHSNIYGPHDKFLSEKSHVFAATIDKVMDPQAKNVVVWGDGSETRDWLHIDDLSEFLQKCLGQNSQFELANVGLGKAHSIKSMVEQVVTASGKNLPIEYDTSQPSIGNHLALDINHSKELFNWEPKISLESGIEKTLKWYKDNLLPLR